MEIILNTQCYVSTEKITCGPVDSEANINKKFFCPYA